MRPVLNFLDKNLILDIIAQAYDLLFKIGVEINNPEIVGLLSDYGAKVLNNRVFIKRELIEKSLKTVPESFKLYNVNGEETHDFSGSKIHFTPGSAAINILDIESNQIRKPVTSDYIQYVKLMSKLDNIASQSTAIITNDVHEMISDSYRLYLSLIYCEKPVVTGAFSIESFNVMKDFQLVVRGSKKMLKEKPLTIFSCCPTAPIKWSDVTSQNLIDCAEYSIPVEFISMPLSGFMAPVTLTGTLIQHTAETLSGIVISQLVNPKTPVLYGGSPAVFDVRYETTPMGAVETQMIDCAYNEIGKYLKIPTQAYISLSDSKQLDAQAGLETSMGATLASLSGINQISGPGMLDFESCQSLEKLVLDNEICGMCLRLTKGIEPKEDFPCLPIFNELLQEKHLLIADHTRKYLREEHYFPGSLINRANNARWKEEGSKTLRERAKLEIDKLLKSYEPSTLSDDKKLELKKLMISEAKKYVSDCLPGIEE